MRFRRVAVLVPAVLVATSLAACAPAEIAPTPAPATPQVVPEPGRTVPAAPTAEALDLDGYRLAVVVRDDGSALLDGARDLADETGAELLEFSVPASDEQGVDRAIDGAIAADPDLVVGLGADVVDAFSFETAQQLDRQFLLVGAQLAEPTANVTAVVWKGSTSRGSAAAADGDLDGDSLTPAHGAAALAAGIASVREGTTGVVLDIEK